jgi:hypothetical protein
MRTPRVIVASALAAAALLPASASAADTPGRTCAESDNMELASRGACASSIAGGGVLSTAAYVANCKLLEQDFAAGNETGRPYPYSFYGNPDYTAQNRRGCVFFLRAFHTGQLPPGPGV